MRRQTIEPVPLPVITPRQVQAMRGRLRMTQRQFADAFALPWPTVRDWEQGKAKPDRAAAAFLAVIDRNPSAVRQALAPQDRPKPQVVATKSAAVVKPPAVLTQRPKIVPTRQAKLMTDADLNDMAAQLDELKRDLARLRD